MPTKSRKCPRAKKDMIVWKKAFYNQGMYRNRCLIKLRIKKGALVRLHNGVVLANRKCRAEAAYVIGTYSLLGRKLRKAEAYSSYDFSFTYKNKTKVKPRYKFNKHNRVCGSGIHFFRDKEDARNYIV